MWRDYLLCAAAVLPLIGQAQAAAPQTGKYCVYGKGKSYDMLLVRQNPDGTLAFGLSSWTADGSNFSVAGSARPSGSGWAYRDQMTAANPDDRCGVDLTQSADGTWRVTTVDGARCEGLAGHGAVLYGADVFPPRSRAGDAPVKFGMEDLQRIGCDRRQ